MCRIIDWKLQPSLSLKPFRNQSRYTEYNSVVLSVIQTSLSYKDLKIKYSPLCSMKFPAKRLPDLCQGVIPITTQTSNNSIVHGKEELQRFKESDLMTIFQWFLVLTISYLIKDNVKS